MVEKKPNINIDVGAKANLDINVSANVPERSSGRLIDALTDVFRPFSESRGLKGDQIRLQREDILLEIAKKARQRIALEEISVHTLPNKFLVPFMEKASLEDGDAILMDRWADLLATCAEEPDKAHPKYVQILSEMTSAEALFLKKLIFHRIDDESTPQIKEFGAKSIRQRVIDAPYHYEKRAIEPILTNLCTELRDELSGEEFIDVLYSEMDGYFACPGVALIDIIVYNTENNDMWSFVDIERSLSLCTDGSEENTLDILDSLSLIRRCEIVIQIAECRISVFYISTTTLAIDFLISCDRDLLAKISNHISAEN